MVRLVIVGSKGRMGQMLVACAAQQPDLAIAGQIDLGDDLEAVIGQGDVVIDFSLPQATLSVASLCARHRLPLVLGTTGHSPDEKTQITKLTADLPLVWSANFSTGVNALFWLTRKAAEILGPGFDLEIVEMHHRLKKDAPSGTAHTLGEILAGVRHQQLRAVARHGREGLVGERTAGEIGIHAVRGGDVVGEHTVIFASNGERVELAHKASSRETLAQGALRAARWIIGRPPGLYTMQAVLGLEA
jgi:4-hydroxy-tetrahydrodipicolinate reductase